MANQMRIAPRILRLAMCCLILTGWAFAQTKQLNNTPMGIEHFKKRGGNGVITTQKLERNNQNRLTAPFAIGNVFAAVANGSVQHYDGNGNLLETLNSGLGGFTTGMASDSDGNLYVTNFSGGFISRFDGPADPHNHSVFTNADFGSSVESILFDQAGDIYVGQAAGTADIIKYDNSGSETNRFDVTVGPRGSDWIDLSADQTIMFYTSEGAAIYRYDVVNGTQLTPFTTTLPGVAAYALRLLPGGGLLVADSEQIHRLDDNANIIQSYDATGENTWFALNLDPDGTSFWSGDFTTANFYKFDIATGNILVGPVNTGTGPATLFGLSVFGEITVSQNNPPVCQITPAGPFTVQEGSLLTFDVTAFDPDVNDIITIDATGIPANATTSPSLPASGTSGLSTTFEWIPQYGQSGNFTVSFTVTDTSGAVDTCDVEILVEELQREPECEITPTGPITVNEGDPVSFTITALDSNLNDTILLDILSALPSGAVMSPALPISGTTGISSDFNWTPAPGQAGTYELFFSTTNSGGAGVAFGQASQQQLNCSVTIIVNEPNVDPSCNISPAGPFNITTGESLDFTVSATDPNTGETLTIDSNSLPNGATMNPALPVSGASGVSTDFNWTPAVGQEGTVTVSYTVTDAAGATSTCEVVINVSEANIEPVCTVAPSGPFTVVVGNTLTFTVSGSDGNSGDIITIDSSTLPSGSAMNPALPTSGTGTVSSDFSWTPTAGQEGNYSITYTISDTSGASCSSLIDIVVEAAPPVNEPPVCDLSVTDSVIVTVGNAVNFTITGTDPNAGDVLTISSSALPNGSAMNPALPVSGPSGISSEFSWTPTSGQEGGYSITYTVTDSSGESCSSIVDILVEASPPVNEPPVCDLSIGDSVVVTVGDAINFTITGTDPNAGDVLTISSSTLPNGSAMNPALPVSGPSGISSEFSWTPTAGQEGNYTITYTVTDTSGASCSSDVDITVNTNGMPGDSIAPFCQITANDPGPPETIEVTVQDFESGLSEINILNSTNASIAIPAFVPGTNDALVIVATKIDPNESATVVLQVIDVEGNITVCDPVYQTVSAVIPEGFELQQNFPNPFNPSTNIRFDIPATSLGAQVVSLRIYDISGREIRTLINETVEAGQHQVEWDGLSNDGSEVAGGIYFYRLVSGDFVATRKMVYMK